MANTTYAQTLQRQQSRRAARAAIDAHFDRLLSERGLADHPVVRDMRNITEALAPTSAMEREQLERAKRIDVIRAEIRSGKAKRLFPELG